MLAKIGQIMKTGLRLALGISQVVDFGKAAGGVAKGLDFLERGADIVTGIQAGVERLRDAGKDVSGAEKLELAYPMFARAVLQTDFMAGNRIVDDALFEEAIKDGVNCVVKLMKACDDNTVKEKKPEDLSA